MYTSVERPTLEINITGASNEFWYNIMSIIGTGEFQQIIIKVDDAYNVCEHIEKVENLLLHNKNIDFYLPSLIINGEKSYDNYHSYFEYKSVNDLSRAYKLAKDVKYFFIIYDINNNDENYIQSINKLCESFTQPTIVSFSSSDEIKLYEYKLAIQQFQEIAVKRKIYLSNLFISTELVTNHPCNMYMCNGNTCHNQKSRIPRYLYVTKNGIQPYRAKTPQLTFFKDINKISLQYSFDKYIESEYLQSIEYQNFINAAQKIYMQYVVVPSAGCKVFAWNIFLDSICENLC